METRLKGTVEARKKFYLRLKVFSFEEIKKACENWCGDEWIRENHRSNLL
jgi:hypothetical protein